jgi:hypothetical protein
MENVSQANGVEQTEYMGRVRTLHFVGFGRRTLQNYRPRSRNDDHKNQQYDTGFDGTEGLPDFPHGFPN